jgi:hypothetical protein
MKIFNSYRECKDELFSLLKVIKFLKSEIKNNEEVYSTLCNGNIIILGTLFESFTENIVQEYIDEITVKFNNRNLSYADLPDGLREYIAKKVLCNHHKNNFEQMHYGQAKSLITNFIGALQDDGFIIDNELDGINKFSFGKHGESEVKKTFKRVGVEIQEIVFEFDDINNFFNLRNRIVHSETIGLTKSAPPDIKEIRKYILLLYLYIKAINSHLEEKLTKKSS